jgi:hypothetical protein
MHSRSIALIALLLSFCCPKDLTAAPDEGAAKISALAHQLLDPNKPNSEREKLLAEFSGDSGALLAAMTSELPPSTPEEYNRIPWVWRVAIAAGKRNNAEELKSVLAASLPKSNEPLRDWQAVVIGGGIINGLSLSGVWPGDRLSEILKQEKDLQRSWQRVPDLAAAMADNEKVKTGTRYDALRILGVENWSRRGLQLTKYLARGVNNELQQGAISGLSDVKAKEVGPALIAGLKYFSEHNRNFALDALLRDDGRMAALLDAAADNQISASDLGPERVEKLKSAPNKKIRARAGKLFP